MILLKLTCKNCDEYHFGTVDHIASVLIRKCPHCEKTRSDFALKEIGEVEHEVRFVKVKGIEREFAL